MMTEAFFASLAAALAGKSPQAGVRGKRIHFVVYGVQDERWEMRADDRFHIGRTTTTEADLTLYVSPQELERMLTSGASRGLRFVGDETLLAKMLAGGDAPVSPLGARLGGAR